MKATKSQLITIWAVLLAGFLLRIYSLGNESLWLDEGYSIRFADLNLLQIFTNRENNPPLYFIILHWWTGFFGDSEFSVRMPSFIFGFLSIFMIYKVGNVIFHKKNIGILSSFLLAISAFHIAFSQEARTFSLCAFLALLSIWFFLKLLKKKSPVILTGYILSSVLLMYSHIYGLFIIFSHNVFFISMLLLSKEPFKINTKLWILIQGVLILLFCPWIPIFIDQIYFVKSGFWIEAPDINIIKSTFLSYSQGSKILMYMYIFLSIFSIISYETDIGEFKPVNLFKSIESYQWKISLSNTAMIYFLYLWLLIPIVLPIIISRLSSPIYHIKYTIPALPAFYLLVSKGITNIRNKYIKTAVICFTIAFSAQAIWWYHTTIHKEQWRDAVGYIDTNARTDDLLLFNSFICKSLLFDHYSKRPDLIKQNSLIKEKFPERNRDRVDDAYVADLRAIVKDHDRVWVILSHSGENKELINKTLLRSYNLSCHKEYAGITVDFFEKKVK
jgi:uncharacterized membrane protein